MRDFLIRWKFHLRTVFEMILFCMSEYSLYSVFYLFIWPVSEWVIFHDASRLHATTTWSVLLLNGVNLIFQHQSENQNNCIARNRRIFFWFGVCELRKNLYGFLFCFFSSSEVVKQSEKNWERMKHNKSEVRLVIVKLHGSYCLLWFKSNTQFLFCLFRHLNRINK